MQFSHKSCDRYKSIDIEVSISISILLRQSIDIDDTFKAGIDIEYWRYFWKNIDNNPAGL